MANEVNEKASISVPWKELALKDYAETRGSFAYDDSSHTQLIEVSWLDKGKAIKDILGTQWRYGDTLQRLPPLQHPEFPQFHATRVSSQNVAMSKTERPYKSAFGKSTTYEKCRLLITYQTLPYNPVWTKDEQRNQEWNRNVARVPHPTSDAILLPRDTVGYCEGTPIPSPPAINQQMQKILGRSDVVWTWYNVPNDYLMDPTTGIASNIVGYQEPVSAMNQTPDGGIGKVNFTAFAGYPAGTLICMPPLITPRISPVPYQDSITSDSSVRLWNVQFTFKYFDGPRGPGVVTRGHNTAINPKDFLFYGVRGRTPATAGGPVPATYTGALLYETYEFANLFAACNATNLKPNK
jgi:hypothetical protein